MKNLSGVFFVILWAVAVCGQQVDPTGETLIQSRPFQPGQTLSAPSERGGALDEFFVHIDPGSPPEGDYLGTMTFTPDGNRVLVTNRMTDNVTVFDWATMAVLANVPVGWYPSGIAANSDYAVVACSFGNKVYIIDLDTYAAVDSFDTGEQPWAVKISPDGNYAYVACDINNNLEVFDLQTLTHVRSLTDFPFGLRSFSWNSGNGRNDVSFTDFLISPDGQYLITSNFGTAIVFYNTVTGLIDDSINVVSGYASLGFSGDSTIMVAVSPTNPPVVYQIDFATRTVLDSVIISGYQLMTDGIAADPTGSKAYIGISNNQSAIVRFATHDFVAFSQTYTAFWIGTTADHTHAVSGQYNFALVNFATETVTDIAAGNSQSKGAVAPAAGRVVGCDPHRHEGIYFYDITTPTDITYRGTTMSGADPEGDAPHYVAISPDGLKAVASHTLSDNVSIIDLESLETDTLLPAGDGPWEVGFTADSRYAVVAGFNTNTVPVIDLQTNSTVATVACNGRPCTVSMSPDGQYAYVGNVQGNTVAVIEVDGAASNLVTYIPCGEIGLVWSSYGVFSDIRVSPTGRWVLVAVSFDDVVKVIDTETNSVVATLAVGDFPLQIAFDGTDDYAVVTNYFSNNYSILSVNGESSVVLGTYPCGQGPMRLAYNPVGDYVGIGLMTAAQVLRVDPRTGANLGTDSYTTYGSVMGVAYGPLGDAVVMTGGLGDTPPQLHRGDEHTDLPGYPAQFALAGSGLMAAAAIPGPDFISVVEWEGVPHPPSAFSLVAPANSDTVTLSPPGLVQVIWDASVDPDPGEAVTYDAYFWLLATGVDTHLVFRGLTETDYTVNLADSAGLTSWSTMLRVQWYVKAVSNGDTVESRERWIFRMPYPFAAEEPPADLLPTTLEITAAYPNPFNPVVHLRYDIPADAPVKVRVFDAAGRETAELVDAWQPRGTHELTWDATGFASGAYWVRIESGHRMDVQRIVLLR